MYVFNIKTTVTAGFLLIQIACGFGVGTTTKTATAIKTPAYFFNLLIKACTLISKGETTTKPTIVTTRALISGLLADIRIARAAITLF